MMLTKNHDDNDDKNNIRNNNNNNNNKDFNKVQVYIIPMYVKTEHKIKYIR